MTGPLGFACHWGTDRQSNWSGTSWRLRAALAQRRELTDLDVTLPANARRLLRIAYARRAGGQWQSKWAHGRPAQHLIERRLATLTRRVRPATVIEIQDLGIVGPPFFVVQDLSYDLLLARWGDRGVPHFRTMSRAQMQRLRERQREVYAAATGLLPMSRWLGDSIVAGGVPAHRVRVVHPGVNAPLDVDAPLPERRTGRARRLLFVGRDFDTKAGDQVLAAFRMLRADLGPTVTLTIAGPRRWPAAGDVPEGVTYVGSVPVETVQALYDSHDLFVMPSRFEGFGIAFVEALVRGLPCIGRNTCAMPEIIESGTGGYLVENEEPAELAELIGRALGDDGLYARCAQAAPKLRAHYTWDRAADEILAAVDPSS
jgi:glycosyltransferase involved in cell wall biosynthesis